MENMAREPRLDLSKSRMIERNKITTKGSVTVVVRFSGSFRCRSSLILSCNLITRWVAYRDRNFGRKHSRSYARSKDTEKKRETMRAHSSGG